MLPALGVTTVKPKAQVMSMSPSLVNPASVVSLNHHRFCQFLSQSMNLSRLHRQLHLCLPYMQPLSLVRCVNETASEHRRMSEYLLEIELQVREYELDQYGVVNNAVYSSYCQLAHHALLEKLGMDSDAVASRGLTPAVRDLFLKFILPLRSGDRFIIKVKMPQVTVARAVIEHYIYKLPNLEPIFEAKATVVWLDKIYRPVRMPSELLYKLSHMGLLNKDRILQSQNDAFVVNDG